MVAGLGFGIGAAVAGWFAIGPDHLVFAIVAQCGILFMALLVGPSLVDVGRSRYRVKSVEPRIYALLGVEFLRRALDIAGWNRIIKQMRQMEDGRSGLSNFLRGTEKSETGHLLGIVATLLLGIAAAATAHPQGAVQILLVGLVLHGYPVMIQRMVRFKIINRRTRINRGAR
ncbi:hypothetical protein PSET11_00518 [Arthrobacter ulcerisalmonis]|uniref:Glycosyl-4,4'-diaponeurosporenoate acyltransferase n=1 Tax=Arthrobacter ulcerisalmonis TaxID=2483813 RepID=A0A3P5WW55_9MICC|nr:hypothetical protein [Arthrobacter ulcerisalmonis]VDC20227.1 hypothetical protein PSET11_00518 [Arthrobacter ulcerisalmonis]